jgi:PAS domain S-box-containing protein
MKQAIRVNDVDADLETVIHKASDAHSIIAITDADGIITYVNNNFMRLSGYRWEELVGKTHAVVNSRFHPPDFFEKLWLRISDGQLWRGNIQNRAKNGDLYWVDTTICPMVGENGEIFGFTSVRTDVTALVADKDRRKVEAENAACLKALYEVTYETEGVPEVLDAALKVLLSLSWLKLSDKGGVFLVDEDEETLHLRGAHNLGKLKKKCSHVAFGHCLCGRAAQTKSLQFASCVDERHDVSFPDMEPHGHYNVPLMFERKLLGVLVVYLEDGSQFCETQAEFLQSYCASLAVIISLKQKQLHLGKEVKRSGMLAQKAQKASEAAMQAAGAKANFLATMSHEIRTPMNSVLGMLYLMEESKLNEEQREYAAIGKSSADSLMRIIDDILDYSKYEQGAFALEEIPYNLRDMLSESMEAFKAPARAKGLELLVQVHEEMPARIVGDPARLRQIITNFVSNALKFTSEGRVLVRINTVGTVDAPQMMLMVTDSGVGIEMEALDHIFERFSQADTSITRKYGGTGLGLAICKTLAEAMGGQIGVDTVLDQGSTFWVKLPLVVAEAEMVAIEEDIISIDVAPLDLPLNILVAEDNPHNQFLIRKMLEANDHQVTCVGDGLKAVELAATMAFDVILMDLQMPVLDGLSATQEIRKLHAPYGEVPIYAVSANALGKHHEESKAAGMNGHINKPIQPIELFGTLEKILRAKAEQTYPHRLAG